MSCWVQYKHDICMKAFYFKNFLQLDIVIKKFNFTY